MLNAFPSGSGRPVLVLSEFGVEADWMLSGSEWVLSKVRLRYRTGCLKKWLRTSMNPKAPNLAYRVLCWGSFHFLYVSSRMLIPRSGHKPMLHSMGVVSRQGGKHDINKGCSGLGYLA